MDNLKTGFQDSVRQALGEDSPSQPSNTDLTKPLFANMDDLYKACSSGANSFPQPAV